MNKITANQVKRDNSNIRKFDDNLWRQLRKERFKKASPDLFTNEMAAEQQSHHLDPSSDFNVDVEKFSDQYLSELEAKIFKLYLFGGKIRQVDIGELLGVSQSTVTNTLTRVLGIFKEYYYADHPFVLGAGVIEEDKCE